MKKKFFFFSILLLANCTNLFAQTNPELPLCPNGIEKNPVSDPNPETIVDSVVNPLSLSYKNRVISNISVPTYQVFPALESKNKHIGVVIFPGGGLIQNQKEDEKGEFIIPMEDYKDAIY